MKRLLFGIALATSSAFAFATTLNPVQMLNPTGSTAGQTILSTGSSTAPTWGNVSASGLAAQAANTVLGNATSSSATPTAITVTGCNGAAQALQWTNGSGFGCNSNVATAGANANITSLTGLTTPLGTWAGGLGVNNSAANGVPVFSSGTATVTATTGSGAPVLATSPTISSPTISTIVNTGTLTLPTSTDTLVGRATTDTLTNKTLTNPTINGAALSGTLSGTATFSGGVTFSSTLTPSQTAGIVGTTTNNNANAGSVGEFPTPSNLTSVSLTTATPANVSSISLTAGDWEVSGTIVFSPAGSTTVNQIQGGLNAVSATLPAITTGQLTLLQSTSFTTGGNQSIPVPVARYSLASTTTIYLVAQAQFGTSTMTANGYIHARRVR